MWNKRFIATWILLISAERIVGCGDQAAKESGEKVTAEQVEDVYRKEFDKFKTEGWNTCVKGLCCHLEMKITSGVMIGFKPDQIRLRVDRAKIKSAGSGFNIVPITFTFPPQVSISMLFNYHGTVIGAPAEKKGEVRFEVGQVIVTVLAKVPDDKATFDDYAKRGHCKHRMSLEDIEVQAYPAPFVIGEITYTPDIGYNFRPDMRKIFQDELKDYIIANVAENLKAHAIKLVQRIPFSCLDDDAQRSWDLANQGGACARRMCQ